MQHRSFPGLVVVASALLAAVLASCGGGGSGGGGGPAPRFLVAAHGTADFPTNTDIEDVCPYELDFSVFLEESGHGWVSLEHPAFGSKVFEATWTLAGSEYEVVVPNPRAYGVFQDDPYYSADVGWEDLKLTVRDDDGDGTAESGTASATLVCDWEIVLSSQHETYDATFDLADEDAAAEVSFRNGDGVEPMHPWYDVLRLDASGPLLAESIPGDAALFVNGEPVAATIVAAAPNGPFAGGLTIDPVSALPFGAAISFDPGTIVDAFGHPAGVAGPDYHTAPDPGPITGNPSFEQTTGGWFGLHTANSSYPLEPVDGQRLAYVSYRHPEGSKLLGYFHVPEDATRMTVAVAVEDYLEDCDYSASAFYLVSRDGSFSLWPDVPENLDCSDFPYGCTIPWSRSKVNLRPLRGQRVMLLATPATYSECRVGETDTLLIDDVRVECGAGCLCGTECPTTTTTEPVGDALP